MKISKEQLSFLKDQNIFFATPCYGGMVLESWAMSCLDIATSFTRNNIKFKFKTIGNESLVTRGRNNLVASFLKSDCTHLFFIDADIEFNFVDVYRLILSDKKVAVGAYPIKCVNWDEINRRSSMGEKQLENFSSAYCLNFKTDADNKAIIDGDLIEVLDAGTGFMLIKREVIEKIIKEFPEIEYNTDDFIDNKLVKEKRHAIFDTVIDPDSKRYLSEDYAFCRLWQKVGGKIWLHSDIVLNHVGTHKFVGKSVKNIFK